MKYLKPVKIGTTTRGECDISTVILQSFFETSLSLGDFFHINVIFFVKMQPCRNFQPVFDPNSQSFLVRKINQIKLSL
jgi:hypothetical protein